MNRRIYYKDKFIAFSNDNNADKGFTNNYKVYKSIDDEVLIKQIIDELIDDNFKQKILVQMPFSDFLKRFRKHFYYIEAAGGFIQKDNYFLCIHRLGKWDLPKGKLEKGESIEEAAIRECEEECGIKELRIISELQSSFHIYPYKRSFALKQSYWFYMRSTYNEKLVAQTEENIDEVRWFNRSEIESIVLKDTYLTVHDVIIEGLNLADKTE